MFGTMPDGRILELATDQPGVQVYSGNFLDGAIRGKRGRRYRQSDAICLEPQIWPNAPNRPDFQAPGSLLKAPTAIAPSIASRGAPGRRDKKQKRE